MSQPAFTTIRCTVVLTLLLWLTGLAPQNVLHAQVTDPEVSRMKYCLPTKPPRALLEEQTLCQQFPNLTPTTASKVIGVDQSSISYSANEKDPLGPIGTLGWSGQTLIINGTLIVNDVTWFLDCTVKMGPGARIVVEGNQTIFAWFSRFFACVQMWEGIRLEPTSNGSFGYCHIQDANNAIHTTTDAPIIGINNRFNRNNVGIRSAHPTSIGGTFLPTTLSTYYFFDNEFTMTSPMNSPYPGQVFAISWPTGILLQRSTASLPGLYGAPNRFSRLGYGIYAAQRNESLLVGNATFRDQDLSGIFVRSGNLTINSSAPCDFQDNFAAGIETERALSLNVAGCTFGAESAQYYGILADARWVDIQQNTFEQDADHLFAVYCIRPAGDVSIYQNTINITSLSHGIVVETPPGTSAQGFCTIEQNAVTINEVPTSTHANIGIHVIGGSGDNFTIYDNDLDIRVLGGPHYNAKGIVFEQCTGLNHTVSSNDIFNTDVLNTGKSAAQGIFIRNVQNGVYCLNNTNDSYEGITFFGNNAPARIERNFFDRHNYSLVVDGDAGFAPAVVGPQIRAANAWDPLGYKLLAAVCTGNPFMSRFFIHSSDFLYFPPAPFVNPPGDWFIPDFGDPNPFNECIHRPDAPELFETKIADGSYFDSNSTALLRWELERNLYYKMLRNPTYGSANPDFAAFFVTNANTNVGKFAKVERGLYLASGFSSTLVSDLQTIEAQRKSILAQLTLLEASTQSPTQPIGVNGQLATAKQALLDSLNDLGEQQSVLLDQHTATSTTQLASIRAFNAAITTTQVFEENQKTLNEIGIKLALGEPFLESDLTALETIADQPEADAGTTQWRAASLLPCRTEMATAVRSKEYVAGNAATTSPEELFSVVPNPATDRISLRFTRAYAGVVAILDTHGRILRSETVAVSANEPVHLTVSDLPNGVYFLQSRDLATQSALQKVIIAR